MKTNNYTTPLVRVIPVTTRARVCYCSPVGPNQTEAMSVMDGGSMDD